MSNKMIPVILLILFYSTLIGCAATADLEPVGSKNKNYNISLGGPIISALGARFPAPYIVMGGTYGYRDKTNITSNLHLVSLYYGIAGIEVGAKHYFQVRDEGKITSGIGLNLLTLYSLRGRTDEKIRVYPFLSASTIWKKERSAYYVGTNLVVPFSSSDFDEESPSFIFSPYIGYRRNSGDRTVLIFELKMNGLNYETDQLSTEYVTLNGRGALTPFFAIQRSF